MCRHDIPGAANLLCGRQIGSLPSCYTLCWGERQCSHGDSISCHFYICQIVLAFCLLLLNKSQKADFLPHQVSHYPDKPWSLLAHTDWLNRGYSCRILASSFCASLSTQESPLSFSSNPTPSLLCSHCVHIPTDTCHMAKP